MISINEINENQSKFSVIGKIIDIYDLREFEKEGRKNSVQSLLLQDLTGSIRVTIWGDLTKEIQNRQFGDLIKINNCRSKFNDFSNSVEINTSNTSQIELNPSEGKNILDKEPIKISFSDIIKQQIGVSIDLKIIRKFDVRTVNVNNESKEVVNFSVIDKNGEKGKIAAWGDEVSKLSELEEEDAISVSNVRIKPATNEYGPEATISRFTSIQKIDSSNFAPIIQTANQLQKSDYYHKATLDQISENANVRVQGTIVKVFKPVIYDGCNQCSRKVVVDEINEKLGTCLDHGEVNVEPKLIITLVLDDTTDTCSIKFFTEAAEKLLNMSAADAKEQIERLTDPLAPVAHLEMTEKWIEGRVGKDDVKEQLFITANKFGSIDYDKESNSILNKFDDW